MATLLYCCLRFCVVRHTLHRLVAAVRRWQREEDTEPEGSSQLPLSSDGLKLSKVSQDDGEDAGQAVGSHIVVNIITGCLIWLSFMWLCQQIWAESPSFICSLTRHVIFSKGQVHTVLTAPL